MGKDKKGWICVSICLSMLFFCAQARGAKNNDFQLWTELKYSHPIPKSRWTVNWAMENYFSNNATEHHLINTTIGFDYRVFKWMKAGFNYRFEKEDGKPREQRLYPAFDFTTRLGHVELGNRQLFEIRIFPDDVRFRYRTRFKVGFPIDTKPVSFKPYVSDELLVEPHHGGLNQNRFAVGNSFGFLHDKITFDLYYMLRRDKNSGAPGWNNKQILGTSLGFKF